MINISKDQKEHVITYADGSTRVARLFISSTGAPCEFKPRSKRYGTVLCLDFIVNIQPVVKKTVSPAVKARKFLNKVCTHLEKSGLWSKLLKDLKILSEASDEVLTRIMTGKMSWDEEIALSRELGLSIRYGGLDSIRGTVDKGIKSINYNKWDKDRISKAFAEAIANKQEYSYAWRKGYDNSISCRMYNDQLVAHYSEEFKDCGNGHYYLAIDEHHAIFCEDD